MTVCNQTRRIWKKIRRVPGGCWLWEGHTVRGGYGTVFYRGKATLVHRYVVNAPEGMDVCHKCDVPACCNPEHLFLGLAKDNVRDMVLKGRASGKLTLDQRREIVRRNKAGESLRKLGREYGVSHQAVLHLTRSGFYG